MKILYRISLLFIVTTLAFSSETDVTTTNNVEQESTSEATENGTNGMRQDVVSPADINKIRESRLAKAKVEKIKSQHILNSHKNGVEGQNQISNPNIELIGKEIKAKQMLKERKDVNIFEEFSRKIKKKYTMRSIGDNSSGNKIKFPVETESK